MTERARSFWGWGYEDRLPDAETRRTLADMACAMLGVAAPAVLPSLPTIDDVRISAPRLAVPSGLASFVRDDREDRIRHTYGRAFPDLVRGLQGDFTAAPDLVAHPRDEQDVISVLAWATEARVAVIPYGGGTSVVGGIEARVGDGYAGALSLDLRALDRVLEVDSLSLAARIQAGATGPGLERQLAPHGLTLRHYPQSFEFATLGGWIATRAGGHFATLFTHIDDKVESVRMVTPTGVFASRRLPGSGAGPSPDRLVLGSEGVLGVITEAWVRVHRRPRWRVSASVHFAGFAEAVAATRAIAQAGLYPANCRLLDASEAQLHQVTDDGHHVLLLGFESADHPPTATMERALTLAREAGAACVHDPVLREDDADRREGDAGTWRDAFVHAPYLQSALVSAGMVVDTFETACTWDRFDALHGAVTTAVEQAMRATCGAGRISCRFTHVYPDGPAPYYTFVAPGDGASQLAAWTVIKRAASDAILAQGGTITHHHAVGRTHRPWYDAQRPEPFARALLATKAALDPAWILNPGVLIDPPAR